MASNSDLLETSLSSIEKDIDSVSSDDDGSYVEYVAEKYHDILRAIEQSIILGDFYALLVRSKTYLKLKCLHEYMLLPAKEFDEVDESAGVLLACTFPAETGISFTPEAVWSRMFTTEEDMLAFKSAEMCLLAALHKNAHVNKLHKLFKCQLPTDWTNEHDM